MGNTTENKILKKGKKSNDPTVKGNSQSFKKVNILKLALK